MSDVREMVEATPPPDPAGRIGERFALVATLLVATGLRLWNLQQNGYANLYYSAAVRSMLESPSNFFFGSFDPLGLVTVDKPPVALWIQALSAKLFGFSSLSILVPQALMGVACVGLLYEMIRRSFGSKAGLLSALMLALTPICVAVDRDNLPDPALVLVLMLAARALIHATETGRIAPLLGCAALVGVGFNIKMLAAYVVLPAFYLTYLLGSQASVKTRLIHLSIATVLLVAVSLSWCVAVELTPKNRRPYVGGSPKNSALELALGYNGLGRVFGGSGNPSGPPGRFGPMSKGSPPGAGFDAAKKAAGKGEPPEADEGLPPFPPGDGPGDEMPPFPPGGRDEGGMPPFPPEGMPGFGPAGPGGPGGPGGPFGGRGGPPGFGGPAGPLRFALPGMAGQITWFFPLAILGTIGIVRATGLSWKLSRAQITGLLWLGWFGTHWVVFSFARGIFHEYYTTIVGPAVAALAGPGLVWLANAWSEKQRGRWLMPAALVLSFAWQAVVVGMVPGFGIRLWPVLGIGLVAGLFWMIAIHRVIPTRLILFAQTLAVASLFVGPMCWSLGSVVGRGNGMMPSANPGPLIGPRGGGMMPGGPPMGMEKADPLLLSFLRANRIGERIFLAAPASMEVAPIIIETGEPAVSLGGFMGGDPVLSKDDFINRVEQGEVRFVMIGGGPGGGGPPPFAGRRDGGGPAGPPGGPGGPMAQANTDLLAWVREHAKQVDPKLWRSPPPEPEDAPADDPPFPAQMFRRMRGMGRLYDCRPELGLKPADAPRTALNP